MKFPKKCPYCGKDNTENLVEQLCTSPKSTTGVAMQAHRCVHCQKYIFVFRGYIASKNGPVVDPDSIICYYPTTLNIEYPERVKELSPQSFKIYNDTCNAYENNMDTLVGAGLRMALEWLVWDYLIKFKQTPQADIEKLTLAKRIALMDANFYTKICAKLIRLFGNDQVHIIKMLDFSPEEVFSAYRYLCNLIDAEMEIAEINKRLPD